MGVEERRGRRVAERQIDAGSDGNHGRRCFVAGRIGLNLHLGRIEHHMCVRQDAPTFDNHAPRR